MGNKGISRHLTFSNIASGLALIVAISGSGVAVAASLAPKNSVNSRAIINGQVKGKDLKDSAVTGAKVADNSLTGADLNEGSLAVVPQATQARNVLGAVVQANGTLVGSQSHFAVSASVTVDGAGTYEVIFDRDITTCTAVASLGDPGAGGGTGAGEITVTGRGGGFTHGVYVQTSNSSGALTAAPFRVVVVC